MGRTFAVPDAEFGGNGDDIAEFAGRQCYNSFEKGRDSTAYHLNIKEQRHGSIYEHVSLCFLISGVSRSLTHELLRHRVGVAYSQESQRYVDAKNIRFVLPPLLAYHLDGMTPEELEADPELTIFRRSCNNSLREYVALQEQFVARLRAMQASGANENAIVSLKKRANEAARSLLPNAAETRLIFTANLRSLRHILSIRGAEPADLEIRRLAPVILESARSHAPQFFSDFVAMVGEDGISSIMAEKGNF
jgi:thymidylate synthase (FAD)